MNAHALFRKCLGGAGVALAAVSLAGAQPADPGLAGPPPPGAMRVPLGEAAPQSVSMMMGEARDVSFDVEASGVDIPRDGVVDARPLSRNKFRLIAVGPGRSEVIFTDQFGRRILTLDVQVDNNLSGLQAAVRRVAPNSQVEVIPQGNKVILLGTAPNAAESGRIAQLAGAFVVDPAKDVLNYLNITGRDQVMIKVRMVEMQRNQIKQLGFDTSSLIGEIGEGQISLGLNSTFAVNGGFQGLGQIGASLDSTQKPMLEVPCAAGISATCYTVIRGPADAANWETAVARANVGDHGLNKGNAFLRAFERLGMGRLLADPVLTAVSGEAASFRSGGEFPVPTGQDNNGRVTIEFKKYGVGLGFTPVVLSEGRISIKLSAEISELTSQGAFTLSTGQGGSSLTVPGLNSRTVETTVELPTGGAMMIAGLVREQTRQNLDGLPGATALGPLGTIFRSRDLQSNETELVIIVTAMMVKPGRFDDFQTPADGFEIASDAQTTLLGRLNRVNKIAPEAVGRRTFGGPYGHVID